MGSTSGIGSQQQAISANSTFEAKPAAQVGAVKGIGKDVGLSTATVVHADQANLSSTGGLVAQALEGSDARAGKVAALQETIAAGSYSVSSSDVANKIIQSLLG
jgi:negative regulator of flagellin synthesis FlgM